MSNRIDFNLIKSKSENSILTYGGRVNPNLPSLNYSGQRSVKSIINRVTIMAGMVYIAFEAPTKDIKEWLEIQGIYGDLSDWEKSILEKNEIDVTEQEKISLKWYLEGLWVFVWALGIANQFKFWEPVGDNLINMIPDIQKNEDKSKLLGTASMRSENEIYEMADLYYRLHWYVVDCRLKECTLDNVDEGTVIERRKALEWIISPNEGWDDIDLST